MSSQPDRRRRLLGLQTLLLGMLCGLLVIPASSVFLDEFGAGNLPWAYIAGAVGAIVGTPILARAVMRWTLAQIGVPVWGFVAGLTAAGWVLLERDGGAWISAPLYVAFPLVILIGFFLVGGQAGRLFDVREMKEHFPRVVVGFPGGFLVAGVAADGLIAWLGGVHRVLPLGAAAALGLAALTSLTNRRFPERLATIPPRVEAVVARPPVRQLLGDRYVLLLLVYQMLSQLGTQLVDFLVYERAAARIDGADELGTFVARFTTALNVIDLFFLLLVAGWLLRRFGMRLGLSLNPGVVTVFVAAAVVGALVSGIDSALVFFLVLAARVSDIAFNDGATRTALNTAYQAVPDSDRLSVQAAIEGLGVPVAIGLTGVILLVLNGRLGVGAFGIAVLTLGVGVAWAVFGVLVFRAYRWRLRHGLERRLLVPTALDLADAATRGEIDRMLRSGDERLVWLAASALASHSHRIDRLKELAAGTGRIAEAAFLELATTAPSEAERLAVPYPSDDLSGRGFHARAMGGDLEALRQGVASSEPAVRSAALVAIKLLGDRALPVADDIISRGGRQASVVARALAPSAAVAALLEHHVEHADRDVAHAARRALARCATWTAPDGLIDRMVEGDARHAARALAAHQALPESAAVLRRSLLDEVDLAARMSLSALALGPERELVHDVERALRSGDSRRAAHALEALELHLEPAIARRVIPLVDPRMSPADRLSGLPAGTGLSNRDVRLTLADIADDPTGVWDRSWLAECARQTRSLLGLA